MSRKLHTTAHIEGNRLVIHGKGRFLDFCSSLKGRIRLTAEKETRSLAQNNLLWMYNTIVADSLGWDDPEEVHEFTKSKINLVHRTWVDRRTGEVMDESFPGPTHTMVKDQMTEYLERYRKFWAKNGIWLPSTEEEFHNWEMEQDKKREGI